jgi:hypothetical protein
MINKYYVNIARPQSMELFEALKAVVEPMREAEEITVNSYYSMVLERNQIIHGHMRNCFFFNKGIHAQKFIRLVPADLWIIPNVYRELDGTFSVFTRYEDCETKIQINPKWVYELNKFCTEKK